MSAHLPALLILVPLVAAVACALLPRRAAIGSGIAAGVATAGVGFALLRRVLEQGELVYALGGWPAPWGIEYRIDPLGAFVAWFVALVGATVLLYGPRSVAHEIREDRQSLFVAAFLLCLVGLLGICITGDLFNVFVFLEISSLSSYALISLGRDRRALTATFRYLVMGTIGATFILIGIGLLYMMTGTLNMADMARRLPDVADTRTVLVAFGFFTVGVLLKSALFPLHAWLPDAYTFAPSTVSAFLAATATKVSIYVLVRFVYSVFGAEFAFERVPLQPILLAASLLAIVVCSAVAVYQRDVKRLLAWSSLAQIGYMVLGVALVSQAGLTGGIVHLFNHALTKMTMFLAVGCLVLRFGSTRLDDLRGAGRVMPWTMVAWVVGGLSLIGVPTTAGFVSKWYLIGAALERGWWPLAVVVLLSSLLAVAYVWRVVETAWFLEPDPCRQGTTEAPASMLATTWAAVAAVVAFGLTTSWSAGVAAEAARLLVGGAR